MRKKETTQGSTQAERGGRTKRKGRNNLTKEPSPKVGEIDQGKRIGTDTRKQKGVDPHDGKERVGPLPGENRKDPAPAQGDS